MTYAARLRRLRPVAAAALAAWDLADARLQFLAHHGTALYRVETTAGARFVLRLYGAAGVQPEIVESELAWLAALAAETDLVVPAPVPTRDGAWLARVALPGAPEAGRAVLFRWVAGRFLDGGLAPVHLARVGGYMAGLHNHAAGWTPPPGFVRPRPRWAGPFGAGSVFTSGPQAELLDTPDRAVFAAAWARVQAELAALEAGGAAFALIHADLQQTNYLFHHGMVRAIDFEDCCWNYFSYDMAITLFEMADRPRGAALREAFLDGYARVRPLPPGYAEQIRLFTAIRLAKRVRYLVGAADPRLRAQADAWLAYTARWLRAYLES